MSQLAVQEIIGRAATDAEFRALLFSDPDAALKNYELTADERDALSRLDQAELEAFAGTLDERITKGKWLD